MADSEKHRNFLSKIFKRLEKSGKKIFSPDNSVSKPGDTAKKKLNRGAVFICIGAIVLLFALRSFGGTKPKIEASTDNAQSAPASDNYLREMENDLTEILSKIQGAGNVSVRIYIDSTAEKVLAENSKKSSETREKGGGEDAYEKSESVSNESSALAVKGSGLGDGGEPYIVREKLPYPTGIVVVADGARDTRVQNEMYEAVRALYGLSANRIKITY